MSKILIIEPDYLLASQARIFFERAGYSTSCHPEPQAAVLNADNACPDVVILDLILASRSGLEFLYEFRSYPDWQDVPVVILSSLSDEELEPFADAFRQLNISKSLYKPALTLSRLLEEVESLLEPVSV